MRSRRSEEAQALVEFALILPVLLMLILGLIDVARAVEEENTLAYATREGSRYAIVHGASASPALGPCVTCADTTAATPAASAAIGSVVTSAAIGVSHVTVSVGYPDGRNDRGDRVAVDATAPFVPLPSKWLLNGALSITLRGGSELVIEH
ncbi:MAG: pilus assembly protein [Chloroflexota bacterium]|nr:pilus assembly protein [Chloroflexota bacterium]